MDIIKKVTNQSNRDFYIYLVDQKLKDVPISTDAWVVSYLYFNKPGEWIGFCADHQKYMFRPDLRKHHSKRVWLCNIDYWYDKIIGIEILLGCPLQDWQLKYLKQYNYVKYSDETFPL